MGRTTTERITRARAPPATMMVTMPTMIWRLRWACTAANTGAMEVCTRTTARTLWSVPWHPWHRSWFGMG